MRDFIVRLYSNSVIRLGTKPYDDASSRKRLFLSLPFGQIAICDSLTKVAEDTLVRSGLLIQVRLTAPDIELAIGNSISVAGYAISLLSCVTMASVGIPYPMWAYEATDGIDDREFRSYVYEGVGPRSTRPLNDESLVHLLEQNFNSFLSHMDIKDDFKERVQRSLMAFRRCLADNEDVLNEFLTAWSTMEGLDCVYTKLLPGPTVRRFKDGMKDVLSRLGNQEVFEDLERLRNDIAHGSLSLAQATQTATKNIELIRKALVTMIFRILKADDAVIQQIIGQLAYKGNVRLYLRIKAAIGFDPVDIQDFDNQPQIRVVMGAPFFEKRDQTLDYRPNIDITPVNVRHLTIHRIELRGDPASGIRVSDVETTECQDGEKS